MKKLITLLGFFCLGQLTSSAQNFLGFSEKGTSTERALEAQFDAQLNAQNLRTKDIVTGKQIGRAHV